MSEPYFDRLAIYVVSHKRFDPPKLQGYTPIAVGPLVDEEGCSYIKDNAGDNISSKNPFYCELTALYWIWKNDASSRAIGLCHYRRYFARNKRCFGKNAYLTGGAADKILADHDIILPERFYWPKWSVGSNYYLGGMGHAEDLGLLRDVVSEIVPESLPALDHVLNARSASYCNMFVMNRERLEEYCQWLFLILGEVERRVDISGYSAQEARIFGYMAELLLNVWVVQKELSVAYLPVINPELGYFGNLKARAVIYREKYRTLRG